MANLIPPAAKRNILIEYWVRVVSVWFFLLGAAALVLAILNVPVYVLIQNQLQAHSSLYNDASDQNTSFEIVETDIERANNTATLLATGRTVQPLIPYVEEIESLTTTEVVITSLDLTRTEGAALDSISITGVAATRESLVAFSQGIEAAENFVSAEIPLSNLAKESNIPFTITAVVNTASQTSS